MQNRRREFESRIGTKGVFKENVMVTIKDVMNREYIWGFMYGRPTVHFGNKEEPDVLTKIRVKNISPLDENSFMYIWGWPGPDYNIYYFSDYGVTWCFERDEMPNAMTWEDKYGRK